MTKYLGIIFILAIQTSMSQVVLNSDGPGNTYELINSVFAPNGDVVEVPDCGHTSFGRHIDEVFDDELEMNVFRFTLHTSEDDDRCRNFDRQRNEIKTYSQSPDNLLGVIGEEIEYKWKFKMDEGFQVSSSFTHLHQLKAVDGPEDAMPTITLTARKGSPDRLELRYAEALTQETLSTVPLSDLKGKWLQVTETTTYGEKEIGKYNIIIQDVMNDEVLFSYSASEIRMWKTDASFIRPKWGIYRSLNSPEDLRDETVSFADFQVTELNAPSPPLLIGNLDEIKIYPNPVKDFITLEQKAVAIYDEAFFYDTSGKHHQTFTINSSSINISTLPTGVYFVIIKGRNVEAIVFRIAKQ